MNILIVGYGSIGQRHYKNCIKLDHNTEIFSIHEKKIIPLKKKYDLVIIASKTSDHLKDSIKFKKYSNNFLIEKPLAKNFEEGKKIKMTLKGKKIIIGYCFIFNKTIHKIKKIINSNILGKIFLVQSHYGSYLPNWRKRDYQKIYSSSKKMGGGVLLDLIHETNFIQYLFPKNILKIFGYKEKLSTLKTTSEDTALIILKQQNRCIHISLNYWQKPIERYIKIFGEKGIISTDLINDKIKIIGEKGKTVKLIHTPVEKNNMYIDEIIFTEKYISNKIILPKILSINQAIKDLKIIQHVKE